MTLGPRTELARRARLHFVKEVTCLCGWQCRGTEEEVIAQVQAHGLEVHGVAATREEILALAVEMPA
jgi:predicted small metal-binding protein